VFPERGVGGLFQAHAGRWDPHERVKEMAVDGVSVELKQTGAATTRPRPQLASGTRLIREWRGRT